MLCMFLFSKTNFGKQVADEEKSPYRVNLYNQVDLDVPPRFRSLQNYRASLGHKVNLVLVLPSMMKEKRKKMWSPRFQVCYSFRPNCELDLFEHPRFGLINSVVTARDVLKGEEVTIDYGNSVDVAPGWYRERWLREQRRKKVFLTSLLRGRARGDAGVEAEEEGEASEAEALRFTAPTKQQPQQSDEPTEYFV